MRGGHLLRQRDVDPERHAALSERTPNLIVFRFDRERPVGIATHHDAAHARPVEHATDLRDAGTHSPAVREHRQAAEARGRVGCELGDPVVVGPHHGEVVLDVLVRDDRGRQPRRRIEHFRVDAVAVHLVEPGRGFVPTRADVLEADPPLHVLGRESGARVHPEVDRVAHPFDHPGVTLFEPLDTGSAVAQRRRHSIPPEIGRLVHVTVGRDELIPGGGGIHSPITLRSSGESTFA